MAEWIRDKGDVPRLRVTYALSSGTSIDPTSVSLTVRRPDLIEVTPTVQNDAIGSYYADLTLGQAGIWRFRWESTGLGAGVEEGVYFARPNTVD